jgi:hypothetical protein
MHMMRYRGMVTGCTHKGVCLGQASNESDLTPIHIQSPNVSVNSRHIVYDLCLKFSLCKKLYKVVVGSKLQYEVYV